MSEDRKSRVMTTDAGRPVGDNQNSLTLGPRGPVVFEDFLLFEKMAHFNRERIPERVVHAKGSGAYGTFTVTNPEMAKYTAAKLFDKVGKQTPTFIRFSTVGGEKGSADTERDPRGFALKFYTEEGNWDMVGNNTPVFFIRDPLKFGDFIHTQKRDPETNLKSPTMMWDFWSLSPESLHQVTILFSDRGTPNGYRHMDGFSSHTFSMINAKGELFYCKWHFKTKQGIKNFTREEADHMKSVDMDYSQNDLFHSIKRGEFPKWAVKVQMMPEAEAETYHINPFDLTKVWPHGDYPLIEVGRLTLDRNVTDFHTEMEQAAFEPNNLVPGIGLSPDKMLLARGFSYADAHRARLGVNYKQIPVNRPKVEVHSYSKDGVGRTVNASDPVYAPNSYGGPKADPSRTNEVLWHSDGEMVRTAYTLRQDDDDYSQAGVMVREVLNDEQRARLVNNVAGHLGGGVSEPILARAFEYWRNIDKDLGDKIEQAYNENKGAPAGY
jgi:catalase